MAYSTLFLPPPLPWPREIVPLYPGQLASVLPALRWRGVVASYKGPICLPGRPGLGSQNKDSGGECIVQFEPSTHTRSEEEYLRQILTTARYLVQLPLSAVRITRWPPLS